MSLNQRVKKIREEFCNNSNNEFAERLNVSKQAANNYVRDGYNVGKSVIDKILLNFPTVNLSWLLTGEGSMLKDNPTPKEEYSINESRPSYGEKSNESEKFSLNDALRVIERMSIQLEERDKTIKELMEFLKELRSSDNRK